MVFLNMKHGVESSEEISDTFYKMHFNFFHKCILEYVLKFKRLLTKCICHGYFQCHSFHDLKSQTVKMTIFSGITEMNRINDHCIYLLFVHRI